MHVLGVDPGVTGAIAMICTHKGFLAVADLPTIDSGLTTGAMRRFLNPAALSFLYRELKSEFDSGREALQSVIERPIPMPSMPSTTNASTFDSFGVCRAVTHLYWGEPRLVAPNDWKKFYGLGKDKGESIDLAVSLYPDAKQPLARKKDHNRAEAILLAHWLIKTELS